MITSAVADQSNATGSGSAAMTPFGSCFEVATSNAPRRERTLKHGSKAQNKLKQAPCHCVQRVAAAARMLDGLQADPGRMRRNIDSHRGYLLSEPVLRALATRLGKHTAHDAVYAAAMTGLDLDQDFRAALRADPRLDPISDEEMDELLEVRASLGSCAAFVDRVGLACAKKPAGPGADERRGPMSRARR